MYHDIVFGFSTRSSHCGTCTMFKQWWAEYQHDHCQDPINAAAIASRTILVNAKAAGNFNELARR